MAHIIHCDRPGSPRSSPHSWFVNICSTDSFIGSSVHSPCLTHAHAHAPGRRLTIKPAQTQSPAPDPPLCSCRCPVRSCSEPKNQPCLQNWRTVWRL
uniref:Uncharacterized protein n=1 Tax=Knipowitschia caucasica TaxID=637954 RepID=A0AAV2K8X6_KNICA